MKKRFAAILLAAVIAMFSSVSCADALNRVFDSADLLSVQEKEEINRAIAAFVDHTGMDFVVVTSDQNHSGTAEQVADDTFDKGGFGTGSEKSGALYYIDMSTREDWLSTKGAMIDYMTDERIQSAVRSAERYLSSGSYSGGIMSMISSVQGYYDKGIPEGQYQYDVVTGQILTARHKAITGKEMIISFAIAAIVGLITFKGVDSTYSLKGNTYSYDCRSNSTFHVNDAQDDYLRTSVSRVRRPQDPGRGSSFSGGGHSGGSGVHISSSGSTHGGGGGHF